MSCFKRVRFARHIMTDPSQVKCSCIFEGFLGYSKQKLNCLWSYYNALKQSSEPQPLLHLHNQLSENAKRAYLQFVAKLATVSLPSLRVTKSYLKYLLECKPGSVIFV